MTALAAVQRAHHEAAQMLRALVERRRRKIERGRDFGFGLDCHHLGLQLFGKRSEERARMRKLPRLDVAPAAGLAGQHASLPALGDELIEQDQYPAQTEQRQISRQPVSKCRIAAVEPRRRSAEVLSLRRLKRPARMQQNIGGELHRIVPAKILEIEERQRPVRPSQAVVEAEIGRNEAAPFLREFDVKSKASCRHRLKRLPALGGEPR